MAEIGIAGCGGRMGRALVAEAVAAGLRLSGGTAQAVSLQGSDLGLSSGLDPLGIAIGHDPEALFAATDVVIDFTAPDATLRHAAIAGRTGKALIIGTTGISSAGIAAIEQAAHSAPIVWLSLIHI